MNNVILICGKAGSGKNQLAEYLKEAIDTRCGATNPTNIAYIRGNAQSVKDVAVRDFNWNGEKDYQGRQLLLDITEDGYKKHPYYWEEETLTESIMYQMMNPTAKVLIIPDWRYEATAKYFEGQVDNVLKVYIERKDQEIGTHFNHSSETDFLSFDVDYKVFNDRDLDHLRKVAYKLATHFSY